MKKSLTIFLQIIIVLVGIGVFAFMLWEPTIEGRNANATLFEVYFKDAFLAFAYTASIAFFVALYQTFKVLSFVRQNKTFTQASVKALRIIKYCGMILLAFILGAEAYLFIVQPGDDIAGGVFMGLLVIVASGTITSVARRLERRLQKDVAMESENNVTV